MINIRGVSLVYNQNKQNEFCALKNINLDINDGELVILKGISGSGKSTLLSLIALLQKPTSGEILIDGTNIAKLPDAFCSELRHKRLGLVFQNFNLIEGLSVYENLLAPFALTNFKANVRDEMIKKALSLANISHKKDENVSNLSGGERQRCAVARALSMDANIILADEPTANLDRQNARAFLGLLESFKALKKSVIVATHDSIFDELSATDRVVSLQNGEIV
ncbi:ABC transporter ATP-binding protein [Campylobacter concisus]|uniref:ABC transporter ATP-binding protein n=1 Tax=Campylobacter concisus TaxID=199 RepID=UPI0018A9B79C|nr:ABC transporter ATP-binding protein [Campylobacter concisus]QPI00278.1 ABC transporter ATP-binding protein [Campylobacter concisus]QPI02066.1 ABC transporter ATP-binding protein [Campylobacter concisus]